MGAPQACLVRVQRGRLRWVAGLAAEDPGVEDRVGKPCAQFLRKAGVGAWKRPGGACGADSAAQEDLRPSGAEDWASPLPAQEVDEWEAVLGGRGHGMGPESRVDPAEGLSQRAIARPHLETCFRGCAWRLPHVMSVTTGC